MTATFGNSANGHMWIVPQFLKLFHKEFSKYHALFFKVLNSHGVMVYAFYQSIKHTIAYGFVSTVSDLYFASNTKCLK